jgi:S-adenosylmethionine/arginine decarboxylase-like enzyme
MFNRRYWINVVEPEPLKKKLYDLLETSRFLVLNYMEHHFNPQGFTCIWLLGESHLAVHTFPELNTTYLELSGCNSEKTLHFQQLLLEWCISDNIDLNHAT